MRHGASRRSGSIQVLKPYFALALLLAACTNIDVRRESDLALDCYGLQVAILTLPLETLSTYWETPFNTMFGSGRIDAAAREREEHLRRLAAAKACVALAASSRAS